LEQVEEESDEESVMTGSCVRRPLQRRTPCKKAFTLSIPSHLISRELSLVQMSWVIWTLLSIWLIVCCNACLCSAVSNYLFT